MSEESELQAGIARLTVNKWWRSLNYVCLKCGDTARAHPQTNEIWGCLTCGVTTRDVAVYFAEFRYPESARAIALWLADFCDEALPYPQMIAAAARRAAKHIEEMVGSADDAEPITAEWLELIGLEGAGAITGWQLLVGNDDEIDHGVYLFWSERYGLRIGNILSRTYPLRNIKTRGDVRRLCAALGIPLTPN